MYIRMDEQWRILDRKERCFQEQLNKVEVELKEMDAIYKNNRKNAKIYFVCLVFSVIVSACLYFYDKKSASLHRDVLVTLVFITIPFSFYCFGERLPIKLGKSGLRFVEWFYYGKNGKIYRERNRELEQKREDLRAKIANIQCEKEHIEKEKGTQFSYVSDAVELEYDNLVYDKGEDYAEKEKEIKIRCLNSKQSGLENKQKRLKKELKNIKKERIKQYKKMLGWILLLIVLVAYELWIASVQGREAAVALLYYGTLFGGIPYTIFRLAESFLYFLADSGSSILARLFYGKSEAAYVFKKRELETQIMETYMQIGAIPYQKEELESQM